ncbi:hypothetical protein Tco_0497357 [Tanacetum coccineum]
MNSTSLVMSLPEANTISKFVIQLGKANVSCRCSEQKEREPLINLPLRTPSDDKLHFVEEPVEVMDPKLKHMRRSRVPIVKVRWNSAGS